MTFRFVRSATCFFALLAFAAVPVVGQQDDGPRRGEGRFGGGPGGPGGRGGAFFGGGMGGRTVDATMVSLLQVSEVREEVEVMPDQEEALAKLQQETRGERPDFGSFRDASDAERQQMFERIRKEAEERTAKLRSGLEEILLPEQLERLQEISLQVLGAEALNDEKIAQKLNITSDQKAQIAKAREESQDALREKMRELFSSGDRDSIRQEMEKFREQTEQKVVGALTAEQQSQFTAMKGEAFELPEGAMRGGFIGRRGGGDGDGDNRGGRGRFGGGRPPRGGGN